MSRSLLLSALCAGLLFAGCGIGGGGSVDQTRYFRFLHTSDSTTFVAGTAEDAVLETVERQLERPLAERDQFIVGPIAAGNGGHNGDYPCHFVVGEWTLTEMATEGCDATPSYVSDNVSYFVEEVGRYCPWSARVLEEVPEPDDGPTPQ
jgi:hypothetical protein